MRLSIGSDHGAYALKQELIPYLQEKGYEIEDKGCHSLQSCDYPEFAKAVAEDVAAGRAEKGIVLCTTGIGVSICANKVKGVRCALCADSMTARMTREHNDTNALAIGAGVVGENLAKEILFTWLDTPFSGASRHQRRIDKISAYESQSGN